MSRPLGREAADWLTLAASPTFAILGLAAAAVGPGPMDALCQPDGGAPLSGMAPMYLLMSAFHLSPWLKRIGCPAPRSLAGSARHRGEQ